MDRFYIVARLKFYEWCVVRDVNLQSVQSLESQVENTIDKITGHVSYSIKFLERHEINTSYVAQ